MEIGVGIAVAAGGEVVKHVITHGGRKINYVVHFPQYIEDLKTEAQKLADEKKDLQRRIDVSESNNEVIKKIVKSWLEKVDTAVEDARKLSDKAVNIDQWSKYKTGKKAFKMIGVIQGLLEEKNNFVNVGDPKLHQSFGIVSDGDFEAFASREDTTKKVVEALQNNQVTMIGVFGMPGVGKTMLMEAVRKQAKDEKLFEEVVLVIVSQKPDIRTIQKEIADQLDLQLGGSSIHVAAMKLSERLSKGKKVLVTFDDIWERLEMKEIGIPYKSNVLGCKVLFTTRRESVCDRMEVHEKIEMGVLADTDGWKLFRQKVGDVVDSSSSHREVARDVFSECKGLPLAIVTLGLALRNKDQTVWLDASTQLKKSNFEGEGMDRVISIVKLSYTFLSDDKARMCFLFCSLFPEDFRIKFDVLLSYMLGEELLRKGDSMEEARNGLHTVIDTLTSSGILLRSEEGAITMHDVIRDAAIRIASDPKEGEGFIVRSGLGLEYWPSLDRECRRLSLMRNKLGPSGLPTQISASLLLTLSLSLNPNIEEIPSDFFKEMKHLKTLDLSETGIKALPESFRCLESLRTLLMEDCSRLIDICLVGELERLEILSISRSEKVEIPVSLQKLTNLKMLNAHGVKSLIPPKVISSLIRLEELYLKHDIINMWGDYIGTDPLFLSEVASEVASLTRMSRLEIRVPVECLWEDIPTSNLKKLSKFSIAVGQSSSARWFDKYDQLGTRMVSLDMESSTQDLESSTWIGVFLENTEILELHNIQNVADLNANGLYHNSLSQLYVSYCELLKHLLSTTTSATTNSRKPLLFSNLQELRLFELDKFVAICDGPIPEGFLCKLKKLDVRWCLRVSPILIPFDLLGNLQMLEKLRLEYCYGLDKLVELEGFSMSKQPPSLIFPCLRIIQINYCTKLKCVIPLKAARHLLQQLEALNITGCSNIEMIFEGDDGDKATLPQLKKLTFSNLPSLSSFGPPGLFFDFPALIDMGVLKCGNLSRFPLLGKESIPKLQTLTVNSRSWLDGLEWEDESLKDHLKSLPGLVERRY